ncbi:MAG: hypothetical protein ACI8QZ_002874 [Chlamydiales bacterium]|jgi:hypothetical protein
MTYPTQPSFIARTLLGLGFALRLCSGAIAQMAPPEQETFVPCVEGQRTTLCYREYTSCNIDTNVDTDIFEFFGRAGDNVRFSLNSPNGLDPVVTFLMGGVQFDATSCGNGCSIRYDMVPLPSTGLVTFIVSDGGQNEGGPYSITLERLLPSVPVPAIDYDVTYTLGVDYNVDHDWVSFEAVAGSLIQIGLNSPNGLDPVLEIFAPDGTVTAVSCGNGCSLSTPIFAPVTGTYYVLLSDGGLNEGGTVSMILTCVSGGCAPPRTDMALGSNYCTSTPNSSGNPAVISASGSTVIGDNYLNLRVDDAPPSKFGIFFFGQNQIMAPLGQGFLCIGSPQLRLPLVRTCASGAVQFSPQLPSLPQGTMVSPGSTWSFQFWFRDQNPNVTTNTSDGIEITFQ